MMDDGGGTKEEKRGTMDEGRKKKISSFRELEVYKLAFETAMEIFEISKRFPKEEQYSLTDQIRRSSRSVCTNIAEGWRKRRYEAMFINKLSDSAAEAAETQVWLDFSLKTKYIDIKTFKIMDEKYEHIFAMLANMEKMSKSFCNNRDANAGILRPSSIVSHPSEHVK